MTETDVTTQPLRRWCAPALCLLVLAGCAPEPRLPDLDAIYRDAALGAQRADRRPLIGIPGTLGSRLVDAVSGRVIWGGGGSRGISADPEDREEFRLIALPIPKVGAPLINATDTVQPAGVLEVAMIEILGVPVDLEVYAGIDRTLRAGGFEFLSPDAYSAGADGAVAANAPASGIYRFDYDWRRDLIETAHQFGRYVQDRRRDVARMRGVPEETIQFDLIAHSMGGLIARYFLMHGFAAPDTADPTAPLPPVSWDGAPFFNRVIFVATPNAGSIIALDNLINGKDLGPFQPEFPAALLGTHHSVYQLMPRPRHRRVRLGQTEFADLYDPALWQAQGWGLADRAADRQLAWLMPDEPDAEARRRRALAHQARLLNRARLFHIMMDRWAPPPEGIDMFLVVGGGFETPSTAQVDPATGAFTIDGVAEGDGVVLRASALLDEAQGGQVPRQDRFPLRFDTTLFLPDEHVELTKNPVFGDNLLYWLLDAPREGAPLARPRRTEFLGARADAPDADPPGEFARAGSDQ
ncbi:MAG: hypothetical protein AAFV19_19150 [Pseudomonadota bacterium]